MFLTIFFIIVPGIFILLGRSIPYSIGNVFASYSLLSGIGYVWIIRVFFTIAIVSPLIFKISKKMNTILRKFLTIIFLLLIQEFLCVLSEQLNGRIQFLFEQLIAISFGYTIVALIGMWAIIQSKKESLYLGIFFLSIFTSIGFVNGFKLVSKQKYPPTTYFLTFGIGISLLLLFLISNKVMNNLLNAKAVNWFSKYSLELYYWHIFPVTFFEYFSPNSNWMFKYLITLTVTLIITKLQIKYLPNMFCFNFQLSPKVKSNKLFKAIKSLDGR